MNMLLIDQEIYVRLGFFGGIFFCMAVWEMLAPRRMLRQAKKVRWANNIGLTVFNGILLRIVFPVAAVGTAVAAHENGWGLFNRMDAPLWLKGAVSIMVLDLAIYTQHVVFHKVPVLWRLHRMHHTDLDLDVTSGARFHPVEILLSMVIKMGVVILLGAPAWSVVVFEILLNGTSMFNHSNIAMNQKADGLARLLVVTPDMHRVHHSVVIRETDSNYGFNFPWWDRLFGTYRAQPAAGHKQMTIGLANYQDSRWLRFPWMLWTPFGKPYR